MALYRLDELEAAVVRRNPLLADRLRPGLSEPKVTAMLTKAKVAGSIEPLIALYCWRNGTIFDEALRTSKAGFFPGDIYHFIDLKKAIEHMKAHKECIFSRFPDLAGRYLPVFWNASTNWLALDLRSSGRGAIVLIRFYIREASLKNGCYEAEIPEKDPPREVYSSFEEFIADAIRANREDAPLACFRTQ